MKTKIIFLLFLISTGVFAQTEPAWINNYPVNNRYYTGIGSSNTGNKSSDYEKALVKARLNLAAEISTNIKAETEIITSDSTNKGLSESFTEKINQSVEQYLRELEIVDTFYSGRQGYWVYIRLNKNRWKEIQQNEMNELFERISRIISDDYFTGDLTTSDKLFKLTSAVALIEQSPYKEILKGTIGRYTGNINDFLNSEIYKISTDISLTINNHTNSVELGEDFEFRVLCKSSDYYIGKLPVSVFIENKKITELFTDINGISRIKIDSSMLKNGNNRIFIKIEPQSIGLLDNYSATENFLIEYKQFSVQLESVSLYLNIVSNKTELSFLENPIRSLFSTENRKFTISKDSLSSRYNLIISLTFTNYPRVLDNAPLMAGLECIISLRKEDQILLDYKCDSLKDGGLTYKQAYNRVFNKLIRKLETDRDYITEIERVLSR